MAAGRLTWPRAARPFGQLEEGQLFARRRDAVVLGLVALAILPYSMWDVVATWPRAVELWGHDFNLNLDAAARWLAGGPFYPAEQLAESFTDDGQRILYPPSALWLFGPLAALPRGVAAVIWWALPIWAISDQVRRMRPRPITWPFIAICVVWPSTVLSIVVWNPGLFFAGLLALGTIHHWPSALIGLKPSVLPFALWGASHRSWWVTVGVMVLFSLPFGFMWLDWLQVLRNSDVGGMWHSIQQLPIFLIPILVWLGRSHK